MPKEVMTEILDEQAQVVVKAQKRTADSMLSGPYNKGAVKKAITAGATKVSSDGYKKYITFNGTQHGNKIAEIAFINEYGKTNQSARPFIKQANESCADEVQEAGEKAFDNWLNNK